MPFTLSDLLTDVRGARRHFLKHVNGLRDDQWTWKPYPECKSVAETLAHLISVDRMALESLRTGEMPDFVAFDVAECDREQLLTLLADSHAQLCAFLEERYWDAPLDLEVRLYGDPRKLGSAVAYLTSEDFYHSGQVAFIRMATDPGWDYYGQIYLA